MIALLALQAAVAGPAPPAPLRLRSAGDRPCPVATAGEDIVVCARRNDDAFRLPRLPDRYATRRDRKAEIPLPGTMKAAAEVEGANIGGVQSNRVMMRLKLPF